MLNNLIFSKKKSLFEKALNNGEVLDEAIVFIEDTKEIWNHGTYFDGNKVDLSNIEASILNIVDNYATKEEIPTKTSELENDTNYISSGNLKTINGESILGEGDININVVTENTVSNWGFTKNTGTITGVSANGTSVATNGVANIPAASTSLYGVTKLSSATDSTSTSLAATASAVKAAYDLANSYKGTVTSVKINGSTKNPSSGVVDLGTVITSHQDVSGKMDKIPVLDHGTGSTTLSIAPNVLHKWGTVSILTVTLTAPTNTSVYNEYMILFSSGSTPMTLSVPSSVKWVVEPKIEANKTYQISIVDNIGIIVGV